jgi:Cutinase
MEVGGSAGECRDVLFVGGRGSGDFGPGSDGWPRGRTKIDHYGLGPDVNEVLDQIKSDVGNVRFQVESVDYHADRVQTLAHDIPKYFRDLSAGVSWTLKHLQQRAGECPRQPIVLAGYSQGAMVMHRVLHKLGDSSDGHKILARVTAAVLIGDGDQVPHDSDSRYGTTSLGARGIGLAFRKDSHSSSAKFSRGLKPRVLSVCNNKDLVCDWYSFDLEPGNFAYGVYVHTHYEGSRPLRRAADQAARDLLALRHTSLGWDTGIEVPGIANLNQSGNADVASVSCASAGNCAVAGYYTDRINDRQAFVADEANGSWEKAIEIPGIDVLNNFDATANSVSCASPGDCIVGGSYSTGIFVNDQAFIAEESDGSWDNAGPVPGTYGLIPSTVNSVSCASVKYCTVGGSYTDSSGRQAFVDDDVNGYWHNALEVTGIADLNTGGAEVNSVSCSSAGNCTAGGDYDNDGLQAFVADEVKGAWKKALGVPGVDDPGSGGVSTVDSVSCASAGNCAAGGYMSSARGREAFVIDEGSHS